MRKPDPPLGKAAATKVIEQNVEAIAELMEEEARALTHHQRNLERMLRILAVPAFLYAALAVVSVWVAANIVVKHSGGTPWDEPPFFWMQMAISLLGFTMTAVVVINQSRQGRSAERNAHLDLQVNLLTDQKAAKIIELLEELRRDIPNISNRIDEQAEELKVAVDPTLVAAALAEHLSEEDEEP